MSSIIGWDVTKHGGSVVLLDQCCPTFLCTRAQFTDAYGGAGATTLLLVVLLLLLLLLLLIIIIITIKTIIIK
jgi:hypothetical protein